MTIDVLSHGALECLVPRLHHNKHLTPGALETSTTAAAVPHGGSDFPRSLNEGMDVHVSNTKPHLLATVTAETEADHAPIARACLSAGTPLQGPAPTKIKPDLGSDQCPLSTFTFSQDAPVRSTPFHFPSKIPPLRRQGVKRRRPSTDVDGPNTACLSCKKRRLRLDLITSRLSRPFSLPATHILNREAAAAGDKRFLKLAAIMAARRIAGSGPQGQLHSPDQPGPSEMLRRAAIINRFRLRVYRHAAARGDSGVAQVAGSASLLQLSQGLGVVSGARFPGHHGPPGSVVPNILPLLPALPPSGSPHPLSKAAAARSPSPSRLTATAITTMTATTATTTMAASTPPTPARERELDAEEAEDRDNGCAFPGSEWLECRYHDDDEEEERDGTEVYADFGVIFGGGSDADSDEEYQDYMDDLDGIPWSVR